MPWLFARMIKLFGKPLVFNEMLKIINYLLDNFEDVVDRLWLVNR